MKHPVAGTPVIARTFHGVEWVLAAEISTALGVDGSVGLARREVRFRVPEPGPELLELRTADDVFLEVGVLERVPSGRRELPALGTAALSLGWPAALTGLRAVGRDRPPATFDVVVSLEGRHAYNRFECEAAFGSALQRVLGATFLERGPDGRSGGRSELTVRVFVRQDRAVVAVRVGRDPLHRRTYKQDMTRGTLHPPAAAAIAAIAAPHRGVALDPFCGDGSIAIEAALMRPQLRMFAGDLDPLRVANARRNADRAGVQVRLSCTDAGAPADTGGPVDAVLTNPPWSRAVEWGGSLATSPLRLWDGLPSLLGRAGVLCSVTDVDLDIPAVLARGGWSIAMSPQLRLAGRVVHLVLAAPPGRPPASLPPELERWRRRAVLEGVVTEGGF